METINLEILGYFCDEAIEQLKAWPGICHALEGQVSTTVGDWEVLCRNMHNIKGTSRSVGLPGLGEFSRLVEEYLFALRDGKLKLQAQRLALVLESQTILLDWLTRVKVDAGYSPKIDDFVEKLKKASDSSVN